MSSAGDRAECVPKGADIEAGGVVDDDLTAR